MSSRDRRYEEYGIDHRFADPRTYGPRESYYGNGRYPPDWHRRREAIWAHQRYRCGRCDRYKAHVDGSVVHHLHHLADGGSNRLANLVGLCGDCHALMHPTLDVAGFLGNAPVFPASTALAQVAVIRSPTGDATLRFDLERLGDLSPPPDDNHLAITTATVPTSARVATRAEAELDQFLTDRGFVPRSSPHARLQIEPQFHGYRGTFTSFTPDVSVTSDAAATETEWEGGNRCYTAMVSADGTYAAVEVEDGVGETQRDRCDIRGGEHYRMAVPLTPPPITARTAPRYAFDALWYGSGRAFKWGLFPGLLIAWRVPEVIPFEGWQWWLGVLLLIVLIGMVVRAPVFVRELRENPA